jgi:hypothetical protein
MQRHIDDIKLELEFLGGYYLRPMISHLTFMMEIGHGRYRELCRRHKVKEFQEIIICIEVRAEKVSTISVLVAHQI